MASNGDKTKTQAMSHLKSLVRVPRFVAEVSLDGAPLHLAMFGDAEEATSWATDESIRSLYRDIARKTDGSPGHYIRMTLNVVSDDVTPGMSEMVVSIAESFQTWELGTRPESVPVVKTANRKAKEAEAAPKTTTKKPVAKTATAKKPAAKKAAPRRAGGAGPKATAKKPAAKARRSTTRRSR